MFLEEMKKLYIKQFGLILVVIFIISDIFFVNFLYPYRSFTDEITEKHFYEYMDKFSGELTAEKECEILAEQNRIIDAKNAEYVILQNLVNGKYSDESEFISEFERCRAVTECEDAFQILFEQYNYSKEAPQERYIMRGNYSGLGADFPNIFLLSLVIILTVLLFLVEENSGMITLIRIGENGERILYSKLFSLVILVFVGQIFNTVLEFIMLISRGNFDELCYPVQSVEFFQSCPYDISIIQTFLLTSVMKLLGYLFISCAIILLSVTIRKALFVIFIPCSVCLLQQFAFNPTTPAYYIPTGFLRTVGYFRGDIFSESESGENIKVFSEISLISIIALACIVLAFIVISIIEARKYYTCGKRRRKEILVITSIMCILVTLSGCKNNSKDKIIFNLQEGMYFAQDNDNFFISTENGIFKISKKDNSGSELIRDVFETEEHLRTIALCGEELFYNNWLDVLNVKKLSLKDFCSESVISNPDDTRKGFLGLNAQLNNNFSHIVTGIFTDGNSIFAVFGNSVYQIKNGKVSCIIKNDIYNEMLCFDGQKIFYINSILKLYYYDIKTGETICLPGEFVRAVYYDGIRVLYSDQNGIYSLDLVNFSTMKISDISSYRLSSDGERIVYGYEDKIYFLSEHPIEVYDKDIVSFSIISRTNKLAILHNDFSSEILDLPIIT